MTVTANSKIIFRSIPSIFRSMQSKMSCHLTASQMSVQSVWWSEVRRRKLSPVTHWWGTEQWLMFVVVEVGKNSGSIQTQRPANEPPGGWPDLIGRNCNFGRCLCVDCPFSTWRPCQKLSHIRAKQHTKICFRKHLRREISSAETESGFTFDQLSLVSQFEVSLSRCPSARWKCSFA